MQNFMNGRRNTAEFCCAFCWLLRVQIPCRLENCQTDVQQIKQEVRQVRWTNLIILTLYLFFSVTEISRGKERMLNREDNGRDHATPEKAWSYCVQLNMWSWAKVSHIDSITDYNNNYNLPLTQSNILLASGRRGSETHTHTNRRGGGCRQQRKDSSTGHDEVVHHLRNEMDGVVHKYHILTAVHKVHNCLSRMTVGRSEKISYATTCYWGSRRVITNNTIFDLMMTNKNVQKKFYSKSTFPKLKVTE